MDFSKIEDPIVKDYLMKKYGSNKVQGAQEQVDNTELLSAGVGAADKIANAFGNQPVIMQNRMQDLGKTPDMIAQPQQKTDVNGLQKQAQMKLQQAQSDEDNAVKMAFENRKAELAREAEEKANAQKQTNWQKEYDQKERGLKAQSASRQAYVNAVNANKQEIRADRLQKEADKRAADLEELKVGDLGYANTADDAKKLKDGVIAKTNFDNKLNQLIDLRTKHGGGAILNREDVARAAQLSKDLLLEYKNLQKLGVLSQSDENIINAIIPSDPLEYNSFLSAIQGQDPLLNNMKSFKADTDKDFQTKVKTYIRSGGKQQAPHGDLVQQDGKTYQWNGSQYVEVK